MAKALSIVQHPVSDYAAWRTVYEQVQPLRDKHGVSAADVLQDPADPNQVTVLHWFPSVGQAAGVRRRSRTEGRDGKRGVTAPPRIEIVVEA